MKMNWLAISIMAFVLGFTSCNNDNDPLTEKAGTGSLSLSFNYSDLSTKGLNQTASTEEKAVETVTVFIYKSGNSLERVVTINAANFDVVGNKYTLMTGQEITGLTQGAKEVYVGVNISDALISKIQTNSSAGMVSAYDVTVAELSDTNNGFTMFCEAGKSVTVNPSPAAAAEAKGFKVDRLVAKTSVKKTAGITFPYAVAGGNITALTYAVQNVNKSTFLTKKAESANNIEDAVPANSVFKNVTEMPVAETHDALATYVTEHYLTAKPTYPTFVRIRSTFEPASYITGTTGNWDYTSTTASADKTFWTLPLSDGKVGYFTTEADANAYLADAGSKAVSGSTVTKYPLGHVDYAVFLHTNTNKYDVFRNHYYIITVTGINGIGEPGDKDQITPLDKGSLTFDLEVRDWTPIQGGGQLS